MLEAAAGFPSGEVTPAVAVFRDPDGIAGARSAVERARSRVENADLEGVERLAPSSTRATARVRSSPSRFARRATRRS